MYPDRYQKTLNFTPFFLFYSFSRLFTLSGRSQCRNVTPRKLKSSNEFDLVMSSKNHRDREKLFPSLSFVSMTVTTFQASRKESKFPKTNANSLKFYFILNFYVKFLLMEKSFISILANINVPDYYSRCNK